MKIIFQWKMQIIISFYLISLWKILIENEDVRDGRTEESLFVSTLKESDCKRIENNFTQNGKNSFRGKHVIPQNQTPP